MDGREKEVLWKWRLFWLKALFLNSSVAYRIPDSTSLCHIEISTINYRQPFAVEQKQIRHFDLNPWKKSLFAHCVCEREKNDGKKCLNGSSVDIESISSRPQRKKLFLSSLRTRRKKAVEKCNGNGKWRAIQMDETLYIVFRFAAPQIQVILDAVKPCTIEKTKEEKQEIGSNRLSKTSSNEFHRCGGKRKEGNKKKNFLHLSTKKNNAATLHRKSIYFEYIVAVAVCVYFWCFPPSTTNIFHIQ